MKVYTRISAFLLTLMFVSLISTSVSSNAQAATTCTGLQYGSFNKSSEFIVAQREGFFAQEGLTVCYNQVKSSVDQFNDLLSGKYQLIASASDNTVNRYVNFNLPISMYAGVEQGVDQIIAVNTALGIHTFQDLCGKPIAVDAPDSGYVYSLRKVFAANGLYLEGDPNRPAGACTYTFQLEGGTFQRFQDVQAGRDPQGNTVYATLLNYPWTAQTTAPVASIARVVDYVPNYQAHVIGATHDYANAHPEIMTSFIRALLRAYRFRLDPANRAATIADIQAELNVSQTIAEAELAAVEDRHTGENRNLRMSNKGLTAVVQLRQEFGGFSSATFTDKQIKQLIKPGVDKLYDNRFWKAALESLDDDDNGENDQDAD